MSDRTAEFIARLITMIIVAACATYWPWPTFACVLYMIVCQIEALRKK